MEAVDLTILMVFFGFDGIETPFNTNTGSHVYVGYMHNDTNKFYDSETGRHVQNLKDSAAKNAIDSWYKVNLSGEIGEKLIEDTIWCNDRNVISDTY